MLRGDDSSEFHLSFRPRSNRETRSWVLHEWRCMEGRRYRRHCFGVGHGHHHRQQHFELYSKLVFVWPCIFTWYPTIHCPDLLSPYTKNGVSGSGWVISTWLALQHVGNIISPGHFHRHQ